MFCKASPAQCWYTKAVTDDQHRVSQAITQEKCTHSLSLSVRSAVELVKIVRETLEALFDLHLGIPEEVVASAGQGLDSFLQRQALLRCHTFSAFLSFCSSVSSPQAEDHHLIDNHDISCTKTCRYAQQTASQVGSPNFMIPPIPSLTRYKKEVAIKAAAQAKPAQAATPR